MSTRTFLCAVLIASCLLCPLLIASWLMPTSALAHDWATVSLGDGNQNPDRAVNDGLGGVYFSWIDVTGFAGSSLRLQHITNAGQPAPGWPANGRIPTVTDERRGYSWMLPDGEGGVFIGWQRLGPQSGTTYDVYLQRITTTGQIHPDWPSEGLLVAPVQHKSSSLTMTSDEKGGVFLTWFTRVDTTHRVFAQRIDADGKVHAGWPQFGVPVCSGGYGEQVHNKSCGDGEGGLLIVWSDGRGAASDIYSQHLLADGTRAPGWPDSGIAVCTAPAEQTGGLANWMVSDGAGGFLCVWADRRAGNMDVYVQRMTGSGSVAAGWPVNGLAVSTDAGDQGFPAGTYDGFWIETDDAGGAFIAWTDNKNSSPGSYDQADVYATHVLSNGTLAGGWPTNGAVLSNAFWTQHEPRIVRDGAGGAYFVWREQTNIRGAGVTRMGPSGAVYPGWNPDSRLGAASLVYLTTNPVLHPSGDLIVGYEDYYLDGVYRYDLFAARMRGDGSIPVLAVSPQAAVSSDLVVAPHPVGDRANFSITLRGGLPATLELFAIDGRRVWKREVGSLGAGRHSVPFAASATLPAGVYQLRLSEGSTRMTRPLVRVR